MRARGYFYWGIALFGQKRGRGMRNDLTIYERYAEEWWDEEAPRFRSLHSMTPFRVKSIDSFVLKYICNRSSSDDTSLVDTYNNNTGLSTNESSHLAQIRLSNYWPKKRVADLGCGGGLLAIPLACKGAQVTGIDISASSLEAARAEARKRYNEGSLAVMPNFIEGNICNTGLSNNSCDVVLLADVLEHIADFPKALAEAARIVSPEGFIYINTINSTWWARLLGVIIAEGIGLVPRGTHDYRLFISPSKLRHAANSVGLKQVEIFGEAPDIIRTLIHHRILLRRSQSQAVAFSVFFTHKHD